MTSWKIRPTRILGYLCTAASFIYIAHAISKLDLHSIQLAHPYALLLWIPFFSLVYAFLFTVFPIGYAKILEFISGKKVPMRWCYTFYMKSHIMKYLPGNVMEFVGRNVLGRKIGLDHKHLAFGSLLETIFLLIASVLLIFTFPWPNLIPMPLPIPNLILHPRTFFYSLMAVTAVVLLSFALWARKKKDYSRYLRYFSVKFILIALTVVFLHMIVLAGQGFTLGLLYKWVLGADIRWTDLMRINSALAFSWMIGYITPGASGGIGVKEAVLLITLSPLYGRDFTLVAAVLHRMISIVGDILTYLMGLWLEEK